MDTFTPIGLEAPKPKRHKPIRRFNGLKPNEILRIHARPDLDCIEFSLTTIRPYGKYACLRCVSRRVFQNTPNAALFLEYILIELQTASMAKNVEKPKGYRKQSRKVYPKRLNWSVAEAKPYL
jgi:hypothetical protein